MLQKLKFSELIFVLTLVSCNKDPISRGEAIKLAYLGLQEYSNNESIDMEEFGEPKEMFYNKEVEVWEIYFESKSKKHRVNFLVDKFKNVEMHELKQ